MECHDAMEYILALDNGQQMPPFVTEHLNHCERCSSEARRLGLGLAGLRRETVLAEDSALTDRIMHAVAAEAREMATGHDQPARLRSWIIIGALILVGVTGLRFSEVMTMLRQTLGPAIDVAMSVILGLFLTAYICMLVASNMERVLRIFRHR